MESGEVIYHKVYVSPRPPPKISYKDNWMKELDSEVAGSIKETQRIQPKSKTQLSRTVRPVDERPFTQEIEKHVLVGREGTKNSTRTVRLVDGPKSIQSCVPVSVELVDKLRRQRRKRRRRSNKNSEIRGWTTVHPARGNRHRLQSARIVTCSCERSRKFPRSRAREEDRKSSSSRSTSSRFAAK